MAGMFLISNGEKFPICRKCRKLHAEKDCPLKNREIQEFKAAAAAYYEERDLRLGLTDDVKRKLNK